MKNTKIRFGKQYTPSGEEFTGISVSIGGSDPVEVKRTYEDIDRIFKSNPGNYKVHEERDSNGHFKSFVVEA